MGEYSVTEAQSPDIGQDFPIIGIGASAGGLSAFKSFFSALPDVDLLNMSYIIIQHFSPDQKSLLSDIIRNFTRMSVYDVHDGMNVHANGVYIIKPNRDMKLINNVIHLLEPEQPQGHRYPIDYFFSSFAQERREKAIAIIFSGNGFDGTKGLLEIKKCGGLVIVQSVSTSEHKSMPESAIATNIVDYILDPADMAVFLVEYLGKRTVLSNIPLSRDINKEFILHNILQLLETETGHDFSLYKPATIYRRVEKRMTSRGIYSTDKYLDYLGNNQSEIKELFEDILIGVTRFFRDQDVYDFLLFNVFPSVLPVVKYKERSLRAWCAGCSTGEEAYSLAILVYEYLESSNKTKKVLIFASDINNSFIKTARIGRYPYSIRDDVTSERLDRFFTYDSQQKVYTIKKIIRDMVVFSVHDIAKDPPFSNLDIVVCRNVMIYLSLQLQKKILSLFHYALHDPGILFIGTSESVGELNDLFVPFQSNFKVYVKNTDITSGLGKFRSKQYKLSYDKDLKVKVNTDPVPAEQDMYRILVEQAMIRRTDVSGALIKKNGDILYLFGGMLRYCKVISGDKTKNILSIVQNELLVYLKSQLNELNEMGSNCNQYIVSFSSNGLNSFIGITIETVNSPYIIDSDKELLLIIIQEIPESNKIPTKRFIHRILDYLYKFFYRNHYANMITLLKKDLDQEKSINQLRIEQYQVSYITMQSDNELLQSVNEELQSANEELETSKEELQSINDELSSMNSEMQKKVAVLSRDGNDMINLLASTGIATVFLDMNLCVMRYTPAITQVIDLIPGDIGRLISHLVLKTKKYDSFVADAQTVLDSLKPIEKKVESTSGRMYTLRVQPYRTVDNKIEGVVASFIDITDIINMILPEGEAGESIDNIDMNGRGDEK